MAASRTDAILKILIVDDDPSLRDMLSRSFSREGHQVRAVADGHQALDAAQGERFDVVLLDVALGDGPTGHDVCLRLRARSDVTPIIMLTALDGEEDAVRGLETGADDYVTKPFGLRELRSRIRAVLRRSTGAVGAAISAHGIELDRGAGTVTARGTPVRLTFAEFELLECLMQRPGRGVTRQELLRAIWGDSAYRDPRAIDVHIRHLRAKLEADPERPVLIETIRGSGYRFRER